MKVVVLMGGYGTRMRPHAWSRPKPVLPVADNTVIGHILDRTAAAASEVILVVGYRGEQIEQWTRAHYGHLPLFAKWVLAFCMFAGRLEFYTVLVLCTPAFWRK